MFTDLSASAFWLLASVMIGILLRLIQAKWAKDRATLFQLARWILIPYLPLLSGHLSPRFMGLVGLNWPATFGAGMGIRLVILMLTAVAKVTNIQHPFLV